MAVIDEKKPEEKESKRFSRKEPKEDKGVKPASVLDAKIKKIKASKMPDNQKEWYINKLKGVEPVDENGLMAFEIYAKIKEIKGGEYVGKASFADSQNVKKLSLHKWDELFKKF